MLLQPVWPRDEYCECWMDQQYGRGDYEWDQHGCATCRSRGAGGGVVWLGHTPHRGCGCMQGLLATAALGDVATAIVLNKP